MELGDLQLAILRALWADPGLTVVEVQRALADGGRHVAPTTVATVLQRLERRKVVAHRRRGRTHVFSARVTESQLREHAVDDLARNLFAGDRAAIVSHLLGDGGVGDAELAAIRALLAARGAGEGQG
jgi:predicted transcriptional regulator